MIVRSGQPFSLRNVFDRNGRVSIQQRLRASCRSRLQSLKHSFATRDIWASLVDLAERGEVLLIDRKEVFQRFCPDCREDTAHQGSDELGFGWYAQISRCRQCGRQYMKVWALG